MIKLDVILFSTTYSRLTQNTIGCYRDTNTLESTFYNNSSKNLVPLRRRLRLDLYAIIPIRWLFRD